MTNLECRRCRILAVCFLLILVSAFADAQELDVEKARMDLMRARAMSIKFSSQQEGFPPSLESEPLFRYDNATRGYVDGTVWRLGKTGRPLAIVTTELHPRYLGTRPVVVYDFLSLTLQPFAARAGDVSGWTPSTSAVQMQVLDDAPQPADNSAQRLFQMKQLATRFSASQIVSKEDPEEKKRELRLLPRPIDRYQSATNDGNEGAIFLFVAGRMPGIVMLLETDGDKWVYGFGRLSAPSTLSVYIDKKQVWIVPPDVGSWSASCTASNGPAQIPGIE
jgi:hypothetical protein